MNQADRITVLEERIDRLREAYLEVEREASHAVATEYAINHGRMRDFAEIRERIQASYRQGLQPGDLGDTAIDERKEVTDG